MIKFIFTGLFAMLFGMAAQAGDVRFTLLEKGASYEMDEAGGLHLVRIEFVSETILSDGGAIVDGTITQAGSATPVFELKASEAFFNRYANSYADFSALDRAHPNTGYVVNIRGRSSRIEDLSLVFDGPEGEVQFPDPIRITLQQEDNEAGFTRVDPDKDLHLVWSEFSKGAADPRGILDDLVFAIVSDCHGNSVSRSGIPLVMPEYLTFRADEHVIPADSLQPGLTHEVTVIHVNGVDTRQTGDTIAMVSYNATTKMHFRTTGEDVGLPCAEAP